MAADQNRNDDVTIEIQSMLAKAEPLFTNACCIYRVPHEIRKLNKDAYTPKVVSIGPFHYDNPRLRNMGCHKRIYCQKFIERASTGLDKLVGWVQILEPEVRHCYSENIKLSIEELVKVILVDCVFIFELFLTCFLGDKSAEDDAILSKPWLRSNIAFDLLLLENQLPFFALEKLYNLAFASRQNDNQHPSFLDLTFRYFDCYSIIKLARTCTDSNSIKHFTDLVRTFHLQPFDKRPKRQDETIEHLNSANELHEAGVKFKVNKKSQCLLDLQLSSGHCLEIPKLRVDDKTEPLFRNMMALEQCHYPDESYIIDYVEVLDNLINTGKDVDVLVHNGIINNCLGDCHAVAQLFNGLGKNIENVKFNSDYLGICKDLNAYFVHPWHNTKATLRRDYCSTPWQTVASIAAIVLLIVTIIQTVCSVLQVV